MRSEDTSEGIFVGDVTNASTLSAAFDGVTWQRIAVAVGLGSQLPLKFDKKFLSCYSIETSKLREMQFVCYVFEDFAKADSFFIIQTASPSGWPQITPGFQTGHCSGSASW